MIRNIYILLFVLISTLGCSQMATKSEVVSVNGKNIYYESYGEGNPLLLLHGYTLSSKSWLPYVKAFLDEYEVYVIDLPGHGQSDAFKEELSIKSVAEDLNFLIKHLKLNKVQAIGFSFGGDVLYQLALLNPSLVESMITIGAIGTWSIDDFPEYHNTFTYENRANFPWLSTHHVDEDKIKALMDQFQYYKIRLSNEELQLIKPEVLIMIGDDDEGMDLDEVIRARKNLPNSDLWILPNVAHGAHEGESRDEFITKSKAFLTKK